MVGRHLGDVGGAYAEAMASPVFGGGRVGREEDVLDNTRMLLFSGSLPKGFVLWINGSEILGKTQAVKRPGQLLTLA